MFYKLPIPKFILYFFIFDLTIVLLYLLNWSFGQPFPKLTYWLNLDGERNLPAWYSSIQLFIVAAFFGIFTYAKFEKKDKASWILPVLFLLFVALSLDETIGIHEWMVLRGSILWESGELIGGGYADGVLYLPGNEPISRTVLAGMGVFLLGIPFLLIMFGLVYGLRRYVRGKSHIIIKYIVGMVIFVISAIAFDILSGLPERNKIFIIVVSCEELGEMVGVTFFLWATYDLLLSYGFSLKKAFE